MTDNPSYMGPGNYLELDIPPLVVSKAELKDADADALAESLMIDAKALLVRQIQRLQEQVGDEQEPSRDDGS